VPGCTPFARDPGDGAPAASTTRTDTPHCASTAASVSPVGPAPTTSTSCSMSVMAPTVGPLLVGLRLALRTAFARLEPEKRALEKVRMELVRTVPELAAAVRERGGMSVDAVATAIGEGFGLDPGSLERLESGIPIADLPLPAGERAKFRG
jgi:MftR C-terminal domain